MPEHIKKLHKKYIITNFASKLMLNLAKIVNLYIAHTTQYNKVTLAM